MRGPPLIGVGQLQGSLPTPYVEQRSATWLKGGGCQQPRTIGGRFRSCREAGRRPRCLSTQEGPPRLGGAGLPGLKCQLHHPSSMTAAKWPGHPHLPLPATEGTWDTSLPPPAWLSSSSRSLYTAAHHQRDPSQGPPLASFLGHLPVLYVFRDQA